MLLNSPEFSNFIAQLFFFPCKAQSKALVGVVGSSTASSVLHPRAPKKGQGQAASFRNQRGKSRAGAQTRRILIFNHSRAEVAQAIAVKCY